MGECPPITYFVESLKFQWSNYNIIPKKKGSKINLMVLLVPLLLPFSNVEREMILDFSTIVFSYKSQMK